MTEIHFKPSLEKINWFLMKNKRSIYVRIRTLLKPSVCDLIENYAVGNCNMQM